MKRINRQNGFTLLELVIAVAIIGILTTIAIPSYNSSVIKGSRDSVQTELLQMAALEEKIYLNANSYALAGGGNPITTAYNGNAGGGLGWSASSKDRKYTFSCNPCTNANAFKLIATPVPTMGQAKDGILSIDQTGFKQWVGGTAATW